MYGNYFSPDNIFNHQSGKQIENIEYVNLIVSRLEVSGGLSPMHLPLGYVSAIDLHLSLINLLFIRI